MRSTMRWALGSGALALTAVAAGLTLSTDGVEVSVEDVNPGAAMERDLCLTVAVGPGAAAECGDLRLAHVLPGVRAFNDVRAPTLLYNSQHASPRPTVAANVTVPAASAPADSVTGVLRVDGVARARGAWKGSDWAPGETRRVALAYDGRRDETNLHRYTVDVTVHRGGGESRTRAAGALAVVNRSESPFGAGWWLAGLERLVLDPDGDPVFWLGGDGGLRRYNPVPGEPGKWYAPTLDRPDTLVREASGFRRVLPGGSRVVFDARGRHTATRDRLGRETRFHYTEERLDSIQLPGSVPIYRERCEPGGPGSVCLYEPTNTYGPYTYRLAYGAGGRLAQVSAPGADSRPRVTRITNPGAGITAITEPDGNTVRMAAGRFGTEARRITSHTDPRGHTTLFRYDAGGKLASVRRDLAGGDSVVTRMRALESLGLAAADRGGSVALADAYAWLDGPRTGVNDTTRFWLNRWGAPERIRNALGHESTFVRGDARFPALVTESRGPTGLVTRAWYDARGNVDSTVAVNPLGDGRDATTDYEWDPRWDVPTRITTPDRVVTQARYDPETGNPLWRQVGPDSTRVHFWYGSLGQLDSVKSQAAMARGEPAQRVEYDPHLFNVRATITPVGFRSEFRTDALGRVVHTRVQIDSSATPRWQEQVVAFDEMGQDTLTRSYGPSFTGVNGWSSRADTLEVRKEYGPGGLLQRVSRRSKPDPNAIGWIVTQWRHDALGRAVAELAPRTPQDSVNGVERKDSTVFDAAGNAVEVLTRRGHRIVMAYDELGRLKTRTVPEARYDEPWYPGQSWKLPRQPLVLAGDVAEFTYDELGNVLTARNADAQVTRRYHRNGALAAETLRIRDYAGPAFSHEYVTSYAYHTDGRLRSLRVPGAVAPVGGQARDSVVYGYHDEMGRLESVTDLLGNQFRFRSDAEGRLTRLEMPGGIVDARTYDADGRVRTRTETVSAANVGGTGYGRWAYETMHADKYRYNARDQLRWGEFKTANVTDVVEYAHAALGHLMEVTSNRSRPSFRSEGYSMDALGNMVESGYDPAQFGGDEVFRRYLYEAGTGRLQVSARLDMHRVNEIPNMDDQRQRFDEAGNRTRQTHDFTCRTGQECGPKQSATAYFYDAENRMRVLDRRACYVDQYGKCAYGNPLPSDMKAGTEEYRYDALGRRVLVRFRSDETCASHCPNFVRRTIWDGDQILAEIRAPGADADAAQFENDAPAGSTASLNQYGRVVYTHGPGIDEPLDWVRMGLNGSQAPVVIVPHRNGQGQYDAGSDAEGRAVVSKVCVNPADASTCAPIEWPGNRNDAFYRSLSNDAGLSTWMGSLIDAGRDAGGLLYRRNRYYDPKSGQFTQEDPIGLAGGVNLYGYANGDPVSYGDPYGLSAEASCEPFCTALDVALLAADVNDYRKNGLSWGNGVGMTLGVISVVLPVVTGLGAVDDGARLAVRVGTGTSSRTFRTVGSGEHMYRTTVIGGRRYRVNSGHGYNRAHRTGDVRSTGLSMDRVDNAILDHVSAHRAAGGTIPSGGKAGFHQATISVDGVSIRYRAVETPGATVVSTYFP